MNMNDNVSVVLTKSGAKIMNDREDYFCKNISRFEKHEYNEGDVLKTQLWCLFEYFGAYIDIICNIPFKNNEISII